MDSSWFMKHSAYAHITTLRVHVPAVSVHSWEFTPMEMKMEEDIFESCFRIGGCEAIREGVEGKRGKENEDCGAPRHGHPREALCSLRRARLTMEPNRRDRTLVS
jgi:hypothetical protein